MNSEMCIGNLFNSQFALGSKPGKAPCFGCRERKVGEHYNCHAECEQYKEYAKWEKK